MIRRCLAEEKLRTSPSSPLKRRKSESLEKHNSLSPLRRYDVGSESLRSSSSPSKRRVELNVSKSEMNVEKKRQKVRSLTQVTKESEKVEVPLESVVMKRKRVTGRSFKAKYEGKRRKEDIPGELAVKKSEKLPSYQGTKDQVRSVNTEKQCLKLKVILPQDSRNAIHSGRDHLLAEKDINQETSNADKESLPSSSLKLKNEKMMIEKDSAKEEHYENQILSQNAIDSGRYHLLAEQDFNQETSNADNESSPSSSLKLKNEKMMIEKDSAKEQHFENQILSRNAIDSGRDHFLAEKDINPETSNGHKESSPSSSLKLENEKTKIEKDSAKEEHYENQILPQQKQAVKDKSAGNEIDNLINKIQKKCNKRMKKLIQKQQEQIQEFHRIHEKERSNMDRNHKLESALIRYIHREDSAKMEGKLKLLDCKFAKEMEENNFLKDVQLKDLEAKHLAARNEEGQKEARWLAEAKACCSSEERPVYGPQSLGSQSEEVGEFSQSSAHILGAKDVMPLTRHHVNDNNPSKSVHGNNVALSEKSVSAPAEEVGCNVPTGNSSNFISIDPQNEVGVAFSQRSVLAGVEQLDQLKNFGPREIICGLPASRESVHGEIRPVELNKEVPPGVPETGPNDTVDYANPVELSNYTSDKGIDKGDAIGLPDALVNQGDETDESTTGSLPFEGIVLEPSEQAKASPHHCALLLPQASEDQICQSSVSDVIQDQGAKVVEEQDTAPFEGAVSEHVNTVTILQSNIELQDRDTPAIESHITSEIATLDVIDAVTPEESIVKLQDRNAPAVEDEVALQIEVSNSELADTVNPVQDQSAEVVEKQNTSPFEVSAAQHVDTVTISMSNIELQDQDAPDTSRIEVATSDINNMVAPEESREKLLDQDTPVVEDQVVLPVEVANLDLADSVNPVQSNVGAPAIENCEELVSIDVSPSCNQPSSIEVASQSHNLEGNSSQTTEISDTVVVPHVSASQSGEIRELQRNSLGTGSESQVNLERNSSQTAEMADNVALSHESASQLGQNGELQSNHLGIGSESQVNLEANSPRTSEIADTIVLSHESASHLGENREPQSNHLGIGSESQVAHETRAEMSTSYQNNVAVSQMAVSAVEVLHQAGLQLGSVGHLYGSSNSHPNHQVASWSSPLFPAPLQHELGKISKEIEQVQKSHEEMKSQLKSDREKEIQEILAQINNKYELKLQEAEAEFRFKKNGLDRNQKKVLSNQLLAEAFSSSCLGLWSFWLPGMQQAVPSSSMQHLHHQSLQHLVRPPPVAAMARQPSPGQSIASPNLQAMQQLLQPHSMRRSPVTTSPVQTAQHAAALSFGAGSRPPIISAITPTANPRFGGEIRSLPPHLQPPRPSTASSMPTATFPSIARHFQQLRPSHPLQSLPPAMPPPAPLQRPSSFQNRPQPQGEPPALSNPSLSALEFLMDLDNRALIPGNRVSSCLPEISSSFGSSEQSYLARLGITQGNQISSALAADAICLSDDD